VIPVVGFVGFIGSGKGAAGDILCERGYVKESFAKGVKDVAAHMFGWNRHLLEGDTDTSRQWRETPDTFWSEKFGRDFTPREALQKMGTEVGRDVFHQDFWVLQMENRLRFHDNPIVITDVRFPNEIDWIRKVGGKVFEIQRGSIPPWYKLLMATYPEKDKLTRWTMMSDYDVHFSEWAWVGCKMDATIKNNGTLEDLTSAIERVIM
jgi:hypothetical protein